MTLVFEKDGVEVHQLLSGRDLARDIKSNKLHQIAYSLSNFCYLVAFPLEKSSTFAKEVVAFDCCWDLDSILAFCSSRNWCITKAIYTHRHFDHTGGFSRLFGNLQSPGLKDFLEQKVKSFVGKEDLKAICKQCRVSSEDQNLISISDGFKIKINEHEITAIWTPGHTPGSYCFQVNNDVLVTGDTLFIEGCGRVDLPESDPQQMVDSLYKISLLNKINEKMIILPGHNYAMRNISTIGKEIEMNSILIQVIQRKEVEGNQAGAKI